MNDEEPSSRGTTTARLEPLFERIRAGDEGAIAAFFAVADRQIRLVARRILRGRSDAPDGRTDEIVSLSSQALLQQFRAGLLGRCGSKRQLMGYLAEIIRHKAVDMARRRGGAKFRTQNPSRPLPPDVAGEAASRITFHEMIEGLPARQKEVVDLHIMCSCTFEEVAGLMGLGETTVKRDYAKALRRLKQEFDGPGPGADPIPPDETRGDPRS